LSTPAEKDGRRRRGVAAVSPFLTVNRNPKPRSERARRRRREPEAKPDAAEAAVAEGLAATSMAIGLVFPGVSGSSTTNSSWTKAPLGIQRKYNFSSIRFRCRGPFFGATCSHWLANGQEIFLPTVRATADYPDAAPNSSKYLGNRGYHPLEELKDHERNRNMMLTDAETARTTVEVNLSFGKSEFSFFVCQMNNNAVLIFPGPVHCEPHRHVSWGEFHYIVDDYGDIFFEIFDDENLLQDPEASNPVTALIGMDVPFYGELRSGVAGHKGNSSSSVNNPEVHCEVTEVSDILISWGMPDTLRLVHPLYFARCLSKAAHTKYKERMEYPSNGLCIMGCLRPAYIDEESYLRGLFHGEDNDGYGSDWRDGEFMSFNMNRKGGMRSSVYKLEIMTIELFSVYGGQFSINLQDFQDAQPDALAHCASAIIERISMHDMSCSSALKSLCRKKKGLNIEAASETAAEKKIRRMLFPRYHRKNVKVPNDDIRDSNSY
ncbi:hypothetical protein Taro_042617, partial [Colocasia esculenta]|nr:hypothetical protein [Colocasia esculenta]